VVWCGVCERYMMCARAFVCLSLCLTACLSSVWCIFWWESVVCVCVCVLSSCMYLWRHLSTYTLTLNSLTNAHVCLHSASHSLPYPCVQVIWRHLCQSVESFVSLSLSPTLTATPHHTNTPRSTPATPRPLTVTASPSSTPKGLGVVGGRVKGGLETEGTTWSSPVSPPSSLVDGGEGTDTQSISKDLFFMSSPRLSDTNAAGGGGEGGGRTEHTQKHAQMPAHAHTRMSQTGIVSRKSV
jgi:hypothetical protein